MEAVASRYMMLMAKKVHAMHPKIPFYSSATCDLITNGVDLGPAYWVKNLVSPVKFSTAVSNILGSIVAPKVFIEIGPHSALAGPIRQTIQRFNSKDEYINTLTPDRRCRRQGRSRSSPVLGCCLSIDPRIQVPCVRVAAVTKIRLSIETT